MTENNNVEPSCDIEIITNNDVFISSLNENVIDEYLKKITLKKANKIPALTYLKNNIEKMNSTDVVKLFNDIIDFLNDKKNKETHKKYIKELLSDSSYIFEEQYFNNINSLFSSIIKLNQLVDFTKTPIFNLEPESAIYGVKYKDDNNDVTIIKPLNCEKIEKIIDAQINTNNLFLAGKWIYSVLSFSKDILIEKLGSNSNYLLDSCKNTLSIISTKLKLNFEYQNSLNIFLYSENGVSIIDIISNSVNYMEISNKKAIEIEALNLDKNHLNEKINELKLKLNHYESEIDSIPKLRHELDNLGNRYIVLRQEKETLEKDYKIQIKINEALMYLKIKSINEANEEYEKLLTDYNNVKAELDEFSDKFNKLNLERDNIYADLQNEILKSNAIRNDKEITIAKAKEELTGDFIISIKDKLNHFSKSFSYFKQGGFDEETLDICIEEYNELIDGLRFFGVETIGVPGQIVKYNIEEHHSEESVPFETPVQIISVGWKIHDKILSKAEVEKVE